MAEDLGTVRVRIEEEGAQEAADTIGDAMGEGGDGGMAAGGRDSGGTVGGMLGSISTKLAGILGFVAFLASLEPIQELLGGLQRLFSVAILPLVALLTTFLRPILQKLLRFIGSLDFNNIWESLGSRLSDILMDVGDIIVRSFKDALFGTNQASRSEETATGRALGLSAGLAAPGLGTALGPRVGAQIGQNPDTAAGALEQFLRFNKNLFTMNVTGFQEQANSSLVNDASESVSNVVQNQGAGGQ